jgi:uncharacterized protein YciI
MGAAAQNQLSTDMSAGSRPHRCRRYTVQYVIIGVDAPAFDSINRLHGSHQDYMDRWADDLILRGPSLSAAGKHTGSIHVIELPDLQAAQRFANDEPYARAGWYTSVTVSGIVPCTDGTMWDRPRPILPKKSALITSTIGPINAGARDVADTIRQHLNESAEPWLYVGVPCDDDQRATGLIAVLDRKPARALRAVTTLVADTKIADVAVKAQRWRRGGR